MHIKGFQKLTALDYPDKLACTVFTAGCNLRCPFCHNASLVRGEGDDFSEDEIFPLLEKRKGVLDGVCITGGEPLLQPDLADFIKKVRNLGYLVKLDTNGAFPEKLQELIDARLVDYVAMDIKNSPEKYAHTCGLSGDDFFLPFKKSISLLLEGNVEFEFRTTVVRELHTVSDIHSIGRHIKGADRWYLQCFKDSGDLLGSGLSAPSRDILLEMRAAALLYVKNCELRGI